MDRKHRGQLNLSMIFAMGSNRVIGRNGGMPWNLPGEMAYFKRTTWGHSVLMGRKTFESIGKPLEGRTNIIFSRSIHYAPMGCSVIHSVEQFLEEYQGSGEEIFVIGGEQIYRLFLPYASRLYMTFIHHEFEGDAYFPELDEQEWKVVSERQAPGDEDSLYEYCHLILEQG